MNPVYKISPAFYPQINSIYLSGKSTYEIGGMFNVSNVTISRILKKSDTKIRGCFIYDYNNQVFELVIDLYNNNTPIKEISKKTNLPRHIILGYLHKNNTSIRNDNRKYCVKTDVFNTIDTSIKAYFLGLLFADGCNSGGKKIRLTLQARDSYILDSLSELIYVYERPPIYCSNVRLKNGSNAQYNTLCISNNMIAETLLKHGVVPKKSLILEYPSYLPDSLFPAFLLGYFDGDGCVRTQKGRNLNSPIRTTFSIIGTNNFLRVVSEKLRDMVGVQGTISIYNCGKSTVKELRVATKSDVELIFNAMYSTATVFLKRKKDKFIHNN